MDRIKLIEVNLAAVESAAELHALLSESLGFPGWYGRNWDAFWDSITGLVKMPETLRLKGWRELETKLPRDAELMKLCLDEMAIKYPKAASDVLYA
ncbi:ribonuclease inhibitor [Xanthomonas sacchari]|uniref:barstar family protein n=1 Tax=Xanthomonas sacchari TaxID=56458 RepID=UPI00277EC3AE|nr:barstar family protein [Xanthomonas sacchari]MDQ1091510.1 ribonuclease inhibitor [Xanthomonas sacchari]